MQVHIHNLSSIVRSLVATKCLKYIHIYHTIILAPQLYLHNTHQKITHGFQGQASSNTTNISFKKNTTNIR